MIRLEKQSFFSLRRGFEDGEFRSHKEIEGFCLEEGKGLGIFETTKIRQGEKRESLAQGPEILTSKEPPSWSRPTLSLIRSQVLLDVLPLSIVNRVFRNLISTIATDWQSLD